MLGKFLVPVYKTVLATAYGSVVVGFAQGLLSATGYAIAGIKYYPLFGLATFFASFVPPLGARCGLGAFGSLSVYHQEHKICHFFTDLGSVHNFYR
jgi:predicted PurR-regulated permease PerM